jgi:hypothetical protein
VEDERAGFETGTGGQFFELVFGAGVAILCNWYTPFLKRGRARSATQCQAGQGVIAPALEGKRAEREQEASCQGCPITAKPSATSSHHPEVLTSLLVCSALVLLPNATMFFPSLNF